MTPCPDQQRDEDVGADPRPPAGTSGSLSESEQTSLLVRMAQQGDSAAMERLILHFQDRVWRRARYRIGDPDEAWEVAQEVFIICFRKIGQYRGEAQFWTWLARIVDNQVRNRLSWWRRRRRETTFSMQDLLRSDEGETQWDPPDSTPTPRQQAAGRQAIDALERAMGELSADHREVLMLRFADGLAYEEIAQMLGIELGTVKSRINRARLDLRERMKDYL